jgi:hypothetical protein
MNDASKKRLAQLHPILQGRLQDLIESGWKVFGVQFEIVQGLRTFAEQDALFAKGRNKPGQIVTRARGGQSNHNYGLAADLCPFENGKPNWNASFDVWQLLGDQARTRGLRWGGDWKKFVDKPHVELPGLTIAQCQALYRKGGLPLVWERATALAKNN